MFEKMFEKSNFSKRTKHVQEYNWNSSSSDVIILILIIIFKVL